MPKLNQKGTAALFPLILLLIGLVIGLYLVQQRTNLLPKAYEANPDSANNLSIIREIEAKAEKISSDQILGEKTVKIPVVVYEDLNKNGVKDGTEIGIPNILVKLKTLYSVDSLGNSETHYFDYTVTENTDASGQVTWLAVGNGLVVDRETSANLKVKLFHVYVSIYQFNRPNPIVVAPYGWVESKYLLQKFYSTNSENGPKPEVAPLLDSPSGEVILETAEFGLVGAQKISGKVFYDANKNGLVDSGENGQPNISILIDASKADNATKKVYYGISKEDGTYEIEDLPPLSKYRIKVSTACPWTATTKPYDGLTLGSAGLASYDFGVNYSENAPCVSE